jgi:hypothetical protein
MKIPNSDRAIIESSKITDYLLNTEHLDINTDFPRLITLVPD